MAGIFYDNYKPEYFKPEEFKRCTPACDIKQMDGYLLYKLDCLRTRCGFPLVLNSAYRSLEYEKGRNRPGTSAHCAGAAVDIRCSDSHKRFIIVKNALLEGFTRIGIAKGYIHLDVSLTHVDHVIWIYD